MRRTGCQLPADTCPENMGQRAVIGNDGGQMREIKRKRGEVPAGRSVRSSHLGICQEPPSGGLREHRIPNIQTEHKIRQYLQNKTSNSCGFTMIGS
jgi:hypothetical protein